MNIFSKIFNSESIYDCFTDPRDGRSYKTIQIGDQLWMAENLNADTFCNGDSIKNILSKEKWVRQTSGAWCYYDNDEKLGAIYGKLYNWYAVQDHRGLAPIGWHIPTKQEFSNLFDQLGGFKIAGGKMKKPGLEYWKSPNLCTKKNSGFSALPGGERSNYGYFDYIGAISRFWTSSKETPWPSYSDNYTPEQLYQATGRPKFDHAWYVLLDYESESTGFNHDERRAGYYVRCIKNSRD